MALKDRIAKNKSENAEYRAAYDEEVELLSQQKARREELMKRIAAVRKSRHVTQERMAEEMKISQARVSQLERGAETLSIDHLLTMLEVLGARMEIVSVDENSLNSVDLTPKIARRRTKAELA